MTKLRPAWAVKAIFVFVITSILFRCVCGANHSVGGASGWDLRSNLQDWSSATTFLVGDDLVFSYTPDHDVVEVNQLDYETCTISNPIATYSSGDTMIHLTEPGTRYFVCGRLGHCQQGLKLQVQVLAQPQPNSNGTVDNSNGPVSQNGGESDDQEPLRRRRPPPIVLPPFRRHPPAPPADGPGHCSGAREKNLGDSVYQCHGIVPLITLALLLSFTGAPFFFTFLHFLV